MAGVYVFVMTMLLGLKKYDTIDEYRRCVETNEYLYNSESAREVSRREAGHSRADTIARAHDTRANRSLVLRSTPHELLHYRFIYVCTESILRGSLLPRSPVLLSSAGNKQQ